jgi:hypothetical protein
MGMAAVGVKVSGSDPTFVSTTCISSTKLASAGRSSAEGTKLVISACRPSVGLVRATWCQRNPACNSTCSVSSAMKRSAICRAELPVADQAP